MSKPTPAAAAPQSAPLSIRERRRIATQPSGKAPKAKTESRAEELLHELLRLAHVDARQSDHARSLVEELAGIISKGGK